MKKSILMLAVSAILSGLILTSCNNSAQKVEKAQDKVEEANKNLDEANQEYLADIEKYREETKGTILNNDERITELKSRIQFAKRSEKVELEKKILALEQKNKDLRKKLADYKGEGKDKWEIFKDEFNHDMDELEKALKDLTVDNVK